jgi:GAF domain-containing protein
MRLRPVRNSSRLLNALAALPESLDEEQFLWQAVETIKEAGLYFTAVYLADFNDGLFYMRAGSGEAGRIRVSQGHRLSIQTPWVHHTILSNQITLINNVERTRFLFSILQSEQGTPLLSPVETEQVQLPTPLLPDTKWQLFLPLRNETGLRGILEVQSAAPTAFTADEILTFQLLADQIGARIKDETTAQ